MQQENRCKLMANWPSLVKVTSVLIVLLALTSSISLAATIPGGSSYPPINGAQLDAPHLREISDEDSASMAEIKRHIADKFQNFKTINEVHAFLDRVKLLVQKHPKNLVFAQGHLKDLQDFLSQEIVTKLIRVDTEPFAMPLNEDKVPLATRALDEDDLTKSLFSRPLRSLIESRKQPTRSDDGTHKDGNFFTGIWCKTFGACHQ